MPAHSKKRRDGECLAGRLSSAGVLPVDLCIPFQVDPGTPVTQRVDSAPAAQIIRQNPQTADLLFCSGLLLRPRIQNVSGLMQ